jgi:hypothetical protein
MPAGTRLVGKGAKDPDEHDGGLRPERPGLRHHEPDLDVVADAAGRAQPNHAVLGAGRTPTVPLGPTSCTGPSSPGSHHAAHVGLVFVATPARHPVVRSGGATRAGSGRAKRARHTHMPATIAGTKTPAAGTPPPRAVTAGPGQ